MHSNLEQLVFQVPKGEDFHSGQLPAGGEKYSCKRSSFNAFREGTSGKYYHSFLRKPSASIVVSVACKKYLFDGWWLLLPV